MFAISMVTMFGTIVLLPGGLIVGLLAPLVGRIYDRVGPTVSLIAGSSIGLALLFTPLFTASLGSLKPELYSHGGAIVGTAQQLAGAAGTALFVTVMSARAATLSASGASNESATAAGIRIAFTYGAVISLFAIPATFFVRKQKISTPADVAEPVLAR